MRASDGSLITVATQDGRRWTANKLVELSNNAILEGMRLIAIYENDSLVLEQLSGDLQGAVVFADFGTATIAGLTATFPFPSDAIVVADPILGNLANEYHYIKPSKFTTYLSDSTSLSRTDKLFTVLYNTTTEIREIHLLNYITDESLSGSYLMAKSDYTITDIAEEFFVRGLDDLFLDIAERNGRDREQNWDRSKVLDMRIGAKLGIKMGG